jgi:hypothetical protein
MISDLDESLRRLVLRDVADGAGVELSFEAPTKEWAARRTAPTVDVYLYDVREDVGHREAKLEPIRNEEGQVVGRRQAPRRFKLSYLVTVWTQRPEDEHRLLASLLACFLSYEALPADVRAGLLADTGAPVRLSVGLPASEERSLADVWSALGGELKPSLDLVATLPFDFGLVAAAGPPVLEELHLTVSTPDGAREVTNGRHGHAR